MSEPMLPCPFCGGKPILVREGTVRHSAVIECERCGLKWEGAYAKDWNNRASASETSTREELIKSMNEVIHDHVVTMQAAFIEWAHGKGAEAGMQWIANTLDGPGLLPSPEDPWIKDAQRYYDSNRAKPFPKCAVCGIPSHQLWMGHGFCSSTHYNEFKAAHPEGK